MKSFTEALAQNILLFDGAMGTVLQQLDLLSASHCPESLNLARPDAIEAIHRQYLSASADVIETNTFGANSCKLGKFGIAHEAAALCAAGVACARRAVEAENPNAFVAASIGSTGELLAPMGSATHEQLCAAFREQIKAAADAGADLLLIETMSDLAEARLALLMAKDSAPSLPVAVSFTFEPGGYTLMGNTPEIVANVFSALSASLIGINCSGGAKELFPTFMRLRKATRLPLLAMPNAGLPQVVNGQTAYPDAPEAFASALRPFIEGGANAVGGCCGTTPEHIRALGLALQGATQTPAGSDTPQPCSARKLMTLEELRSAPVVKCDDASAMDTLLDMDDDAFTLDFGQMACSQIAELLDMALPMLGGKPLGFVLHDAGQADALLHYPGIAAVAGDAGACSAAAQQYGALQF